MCMHFLSVRVLVITSLSLFSSHIHFQRPFCSICRRRLRCVLRESQGALQCDGIRLRVFTSLPESSQHRSFCRSLFCWRWQHVPAAEDAAGPGLHLSNERGVSVNSQHLRFVPVGFLGKFTPQQMFARPQVHGRQCGQQHRLPIHSDDK